MNVKQRRLYPVADWSSNEVLAYCRAMKLPAAADLGSKDSAGVNPSNVGAMKSLKKNYPADFARICELFPMAAAIADLEG